MKKILVLSALFFAGSTGLRLDGFAFAEPPTPSLDNAFDTAAKELEKSKDETQKLKDAWDRARLETTLYDQRAKRAYQKWIKAMKAAKDRARLQKEQADLELQLAIEKRKLAFNGWQAAQLRETAREADVKALDQERESAAIREKIEQIEDKLGQRSAADSRQQNPP